VCRLLKEEKGIDKKKPSGKRRPIWNQWDPGTDPGEVHGRMWSRADCRVEGARTTGEELTSNSHSEEGEGQLLKWGGIDQVRRRGERLGSIEKSGLELDGGRAGDFKKKQRKLRELRGGGPPKGKLQWKDKSDGKFATNRCHGEKN